MLVVEVLVALAITYNSFSPVRPESSPKSGCVHLAILPFRLLLLKTKKVHERRTA